MRVVDVNEFYSPTGGGVRTYCDRKMGIMADMGHELIVLAPGRENSVEERPGGGKIVYVKGPAMPFDSNYGLFWDEGAIHRLLDEYQPDVVENCAPWRSAWFVANWQGSAPKVFFMHNDNVAAYPQRWFGSVASSETVENAFAWYSRYMDRFLGQYDAVVTNGPALTKRMTKRGVHIDATMALGIERSHFSPEWYDPRLRTNLLAQCGLPADAHLLLALGRHHPEKRWPMIIDAVEQAAADLPIGLVLVGDGLDRRKIEKRVAQSPHIRLFRPVYDRNRLARIMASCDALVHGNETETFGLVASEALACGLPLIVPDEGGCAEVADSRIGETYRARDAKSCAAAIRRMCAREPAILRNAARVAAAKVRTDVEHTVDLISYYKGLIAAKGRRAA